MGENVDARKFLGTMVNAKIDRPIGSRHTKYGFVYMLNYGFVPGTKSGDDEELDAYVLGVSEPVKEFSGKCIAVIHRLYDDDDKLVLSPDGMDFSDEQIKSLTDFQERFFKSVIVRGRR